MYDQQNNSGQKQSFAVPIAIVLAGALVGFGIFFSGKNPDAGSTSSAGTTKQQADITVKALSAKDHIIGAQNAAATLVEYSDLECPFCKTFHQTVQKLMNTYGTKIAWTFRHFPIQELHSKAPKEAQATECAADQDKFWEYTNQLFDITPSNNGLNPAELVTIASDLDLNMTTFNNCTASTAHVAEIAQSVSEAQSAGANGTPTSFLLLASALSAKSASDIQVMTAALKLQDGTPLVNISKDRKTVSLAGALPYDIMKGVIDIVLGTAK